MHNTKKVLIPWCVAELTEILVVHLNVGIPLIKKFKLKKEVIRQFDSKAQVNYSI